MMRDLAVVILNWNGKELLEKFLPDVIAYSSHQNYSIEVIVVDNGSNDKSVPWLKETFPELRIIQHDKNYGFTNGYNLALKQIEAKYYLLLNSDVKVVESWLTPLLEFMENTPHAAACMPKVLSYKSPAKFEYAGAAGGFLDYFGYPFCRGRILNVIEDDNGQYNDIREIFWATGACMLVRAKEFWATGGLDIDFFAHMEEIDLCWRLKRQGYTIWCVPQSKVYHVGGGTLSAISPRKAYFNHRNNLIMLLKNLSRRSLIPVIVFRLLLDFASAIGYAISGKPKFTLSVIRAHGYFYANIFKTIKKRRAFKHPKISLFPKSILVQFFICNRKKFHKIDR